MSTCGQGWMYVAASPRRSRPPTRLHYVKSTSWSATSNQADVTHVQNVTDVDDDILRAAQERNVYYLDLAEREVALFEQDMSAIGVTPPTHSPRATQFVPAIVEEVSALIAAGHGYERDGWVYFRAASDPTMATSGWTGIG